jgi:hypothetical protein
MELNPCLHCVNIPAGHFIYHVPVIKHEGCDYFGSRPEIECGGLQAAYARYIPHFSTLWRIDFPAPEPCRLNISNPHAILKKDMPAAR